MTDATINVPFDYEGFAVRAKEAMAPEKITAFAQRVGLPQTTVSKYLNAGGKVAPRLDIVALMAEGLGVTMDWLVHARGDGPDATMGFAKIPRYDATLAAGAGSWNDGRRRLDDIPFTQAFLNRKLGRASTAGLAILEARGDSMEPTIADGALVLIDEADTRLIDGVFAFILGEDARIKRFRVRTDGLEITSDNPAYSPELVAGKDLGKLQIIGRTLWVGQLL